MNVIDKKLKSLEDEIKSLEYERNKLLEDKESDKFSNFLNYLRNNLNKIYFNLDYQITFNRVMKYDQRIHLIAQEDDEYTLNELIKDCIDKFSLNNFIRIDKNWAHSRYHFNLKDYGYDYDISFTMDNFSGGAELTIVFSGDNVIEGFMNFTKEFNIIHINTKLINQMGDLRKIINNLSRLYKFINGIGVEVK